MQENYSIFHKSQFVFTTLSRIVRNKAENTQTAFAKAKALPFRIDWGKRQNGVKFYEGLMGVLKIRLR